MAQLLIKGTKVAEVVGDTTSLIANTLYHTNGTQIISDDGGTVGLTNVNLHNINFDNVANNAIHVDKLNIPDNTISGDKIHGGTISGFSSTGIQDNASSVAMTINSNRNIIAVTDGNTYLELLGSLLRLTHPGNFDTTDNNSFHGLHIQPLGGGNSTSSVKSGISLRGTFDNYSADQNPRRTADIWSGYIGGIWGTEHLSFGVGGSNDYNIKTTERMRINSGGNVLINRYESTQGASSGDNGFYYNNIDGYLVLGNDGDVACILNRWTSSGNLIQFRYNGGVVGNISVDTSGTTYNTTSDRRLKDNIETITDGTDKLMAMNPVTHTWKNNPDSPAVHGFIAQEMQNVIPEAVFGEDGGDEMMSMDYGRITPVIVAALQDAHKKIKALEAKIIEKEE